MARSAPSALVTEQGRRILLRLNGRFYEVSQQALRSTLGLPEGPPGLGITIDQGRLHFEFAADQQTADVSATQLQRRLAKQLAGRVQLL